MHKAIIRVQDCLLGVGEMLLGKVTHTNILPPPICLGLIFSWVHDKLFLWLFQEKFPPNIYYKIFTHRPVVDMCANSPKDYTRSYAKQADFKQLHTKYESNCIAAFYAGTIIYIVSHSTHIPPIQFLLRHHQHLKCLLIQWPMPYQPLCYQNRPNWCMFTA